jgi:pyruvate kinase
MRRNRNAKIVATLGPASSDPDTIRRLFAAGVDVFRLNFSHGDAAAHRARFAILRELEREADRPIGILADLQGPKLRVGTFAAGSVMLAESQPFRLDLDAAPGDARRVGLPHPEIFAALAQGQRQTRPASIGGDHGRTTRAAQVDQVKGPAI